MTDSTNIYGHELELSDLEKGEYVTDVVVISRVVWHDEDGDLQDRIKTTLTTSTTPLLLTGILSAANAHDISAWNYGAGNDD